MTARKVDPVVAEQMLRAGRPPGQIADQFGVNPSLVSWWRKRLGLPPLDRQEIDRGEVRRLHAEGLTDQDIADRMGWSRNGITKARRGLGLPAHRHAAASFKAKQRVHFLRRTAAAGTRGIKSPDGYRRNSERFARSYGLPADLTRVEVRIVVALADGSVTARDLGERLGRRKAGWRGFCTGRSGDKGDRNYLTDLVGRGLLARQQIGVRIYYLLTAEAMALLAAAPKEATR